MNDKRKLLRFIAAILLALSAEPARLSADDNMDGVVPRNCAARLLQPMALRSGVDLAIDSARNQWLHIEESHSGLPLRIFSAELVTRRPGYFLTFASGKKCTLIGGDVAEILGVTMTINDLAAFAIVQYNDAVTKEDGAKFDAPLQSALALLQLASPDSSFRVLNTVDEIPRNPHGRMQRSERRTIKILRQQVALPKIETGSGVTVVRFFTWDELGGVVWNNTIASLSDGRVSLSRTAIATHVGAYNQSLLRF
jgi:hypothetical protein